MVKIRRVVRKVRPNEHRYFDDQLWPVLSALIVLGSFIAGLTVSYLGFDDARWYANAWTSLAIDAAIVFGGAIIVAQINQRYMRRAMQLSLVLCTILHLLLLVALHEMNLLGPNMNRPDNQMVAEAPKPVTMPEYAAHQFMDPEDRPQQDYEKPVETKLPDPERNDVTREQVRDEQEQANRLTPSDRPSVPDSNPNVTPNPSIVSRQTSEASVSRQSEQLSRLTRQTTQTPQYSESQIQAPRTAPQSRAEEKFEAPSAQLQRRESTSAVERSAAAMESIAPNDTRSQIARRTLQESNQPENSAVPTQPRAIATPQRVPRTDLPSAEVPSIAKETSRDALTPNNTALQKQSMTSPQTASKTIEPTPETPVELSPRVEPRRSTAEERPNIAQTPRPIPGQRTRVTQRPDPVTGAADVASLQRASNPQESSNLANSQLDRTTTESPLAGKSSIDPAADSVGASATAAKAVRQNSAPDQPAAPSSSSIAGSRRTNSDVPSNSRVEHESVATSTAGGKALASADTTVTRQSGSRSANKSADAADSPLSSSPSAAAPRSRADSVATVRPNEAPTSRPQRARRNAPSATSPEAVDSPAIAVADQSNDPAGEPSRMALTKSLSGSAGVGQSANMDRALAAENSPAMTPSVAAQRIRATQDSANGPALAPSSAAKIARSRSGAESPSTNVSADLSENGALAGAREASEISATSSASLAKASSNADRGDISAAKGLADVDVGPTRIVDEGGSGRGAGGGQTEVNLESQSRSIARRKPGGASTSSLANSNVAETVAAPNGDGGGKASGELEATTGIASRQSNSQSTTGAAAASGDSVASNIASGQNSDRLASNQSARRTESLDATGDGVGEEGLTEEEKMRRRARMAKSSGSASAPSVTTADTEGTGASGSGSANSANETAVAAATTELSRSGASGALSSDGSLAAATNEVERKSGGAITAGARVTRAEPVDAPRGPAEAGSGSGSPTRVASGLATSLPVQADTISIAGAKESSGDRNGIPLNSEGLQPARTSGGTTELSERGPVGTAAGDVIATTRIGEPGAMSGNRQRSVGQADGPVSGTSSATTSVTRKSSPSSLTVDTMASIDFSKVESPSEGSSDNLEAARSGALEIGPMARRDVGGVRVQLELPDGTGGLGDRLASSVGVNNRRAQSESDRIDVSSSRFMRPNAGGGLPKLSTAAVIPAEAFRLRSSRQKGAEPGIGAGRPGPQTEEAIERGLAFLARQQLRDGSWRLQSIPGEDVVFVSDTAATALSLLAFQGAGYSHREHKYADVVYGGLDFLIKNQKEDGDLYLPLDKESNKSAWLYSHSIAAIALCESYGMTQDPNLREPAQRAVNFILKGQNSQLGGWRYAPGLSADTSVSGWMTMALKSGELAGLDVPPSAYARIEKWLDSAQASNEKRHLYRYNPYAPDTTHQRHGRDTSKTMTSVGLLMRLYTGWRRDNAHMQRGGEYLLQNPPTMRERDTYYWYYATQVMFHIGGDAWEQWNSHLHPLLVNSQVKEGPMAGSWDPRRPVPDQWGPRVGRIYVTTMNLLSLEVYYRHLPLYVDVAK